MRVLRQTLNVPMGYAVHFTRGVFAPANPVLRTIIAEGDMSPARVLVVLDSGAISSAAARSPRAASRMASAPSSTAVPALESCATA